MKDFRELMVWRKAHSLTLDVSAATRGFPREELYGITGQARRACTSIPANIAEGCGRSGDPEFARFLWIAMGSGWELDYHLLLSHDLGFLPAETHARLMHQLTEIKRMLHSLLRRLDKHLEQSAKAAERKS